MLEQLKNGGQREYGFLVHFARAGPVIAFRVAFSRFPSACSSCICRLFYGISVLVRVFEPLKAFHSEHCDRNKWNAWISQGNYVGMGWEKGSQRRCGQCFWGKKEEKFQNIEIEIQLQRVRHVHFYC